MSLAIPLLGMHRSGTSCLARVLHQAGVFMGDDLMLTPYSNNMMGDWEPVGLMHLNDSILSQSGGAWNYVPDHLQADENTLQTIREMVARFSEHPVFGWKDPRTTITFGCWRKFLPQYRIVAAYRHPYSVADSLVARRDGTFESGVDLWLKYNEHLLEYTAHEEQVDWFPYDAPIEDTEVRLMRFCAGTGLTYRPELLELINPFLRHQATYSPDDIREPRIREIYDELQRRARLPEPVRGEILNASRPPGPGEEIPRALLETMRRQLAQLGETVKALHTILQRQAMDQNVLMDIQQHLVKAIGQQAIYGWGHEHESLQEQMQALSRMRTDFAAAIQQLQTGQSQVMRQVEALAEDQERINIQNGLLQSSHPVLQAGHQRFESSLQIQNQQIAQLTAAMQSHEERLGTAHGFVLSVQKSWPFRLRKFVLGTLSFLRHRKSPPPPQENPPVELHVKFPDAGHTPPPSGSPHASATRLDAAG